jgi:hypothetical protein
MKRMMCLAVTRQGNGMIINVSQPMAAQLILKGREHHQDLHIEIPPIIENVHRDQ